MWPDQGWADRFALPFDPEETGYGQSSATVDQLRIESADLLRDYHDAVHQQTRRHLRSFDEAALDRVIDERWARR